jgi:CHAT domain-containing protein
MGRNDQTTHMSIWLVGGGFMGIASIADLLDTAPVSSGVATPAGPGQPAQPTMANAALPQLRLSVVWGDITQVPADIHVSGHYQGVVPVSAERALDAAISSAARSVIEEHTRRGWLVGALGEISYFPGKDPQGDSSAVRRVAVAGMGRPGTFNALRATQMYASLMGELIALESVRRVAMVLIGSGAGNLTVQQACRALVEGFSSGAGALAGLGGLDEVVVVELDRLRAERTRLALDRSARQVTSLSLVVDSEIGRVDGGLVAVDSAAVFAICGLARLVRNSMAQPPEKGRRSGGDPVGSLLEGLPKEFRSAVREKLADISDDYTSLAVILGEAQQPGAESPPVRISVVKDQVGLRWAALTERSTIPERVVGMNPRLVEQLIARLTAPTSEDAADLPRLLTRFVVPVDFQRHVSDQAALVLEVDRDTARLPWEFLTDDAFDSGQVGEPLAVRTPVARQLRTTYAGIAGEDGEARELRALVIGDPGDPQLGQGLPGAREEAKEVAEVLGRYGVSVRLFLGGEPTDAERAMPVSQLDVLKELLGRNYHLVHYAGHGTFDPDNPQLTGWLFADGLLGARELAQLTRAPRLVVANACWSAARPGMGAEESGDRQLKGDPEQARQARLTPVLADEFLRVGVVHYLGTSWRVPDGLARRFARTLYEVLLGSPGDGRPPTIGEAICKARQGLFYARGPDPTAVSPEQWSAWAAYQHYGDPHDRFQMVGPNAAGEPKKERR